MLGVATTNERFDIWVGCIAFLFHCFHTCVLSTHTPMPKDVQANNRTENLPSPNSICGVQNFFQLVLRLLFTVYLLRPPSNSLDHSFGYILCTRPHSRYRDHTGLCQMLCRFLELDGLGQRFDGLGQCFDGLRQCFSNGGGGFHRGRGRGCDRGRVAIFCDRERRERTIDIVVVVRLALVFSKVVFAIVETISDTHR
jgi:hypothetical protein